jgi:enoyl-CoA hydratase
MEDEEPHAVSFQPLAEAPPVIDRADVGSPSVPGQTVHTEQNGRVLTVRLDNPPRNFMTTAMVGELEALVGRLEGDASVGAVVITGAPPDRFITHFDVSEIAASAAAVSASVSARQAAAGLRAVRTAQRLPGVRGVVERSPAAGLSGLLQIHDVFLRMNRLDKVMIAAINGLATGGGCELALACDLRYMADGDHRIGQPEIALGLMPGGGGTQRLTRALGTARALELMLEGWLLTPGEALAAGLVHRVVSQDDILDAAHTTAARLARRSPATVAALKRAVYEGGSERLPAGLHTERTGFMSTASSPPARRGMEQYVGEVERTGDAAVSDPAAYRTWQDGTAVDLTG